MRKIDTTIKLKIDSEELDRVIEKADRLVELLHEVQQTISSIGCKDGSES